MKKIIVYSLMVGMFLAGCKDKPELAPASSKLEGIHATWVLKEVHQVDPANKEEALDISYVFTESGTPIELTINSTDFTYSFNQNDPIYMGTAGAWKFDDNLYPTTIELNPAATSQTLTLLRSIRTVDQTLEFQLDRVCADNKITTSYQFKFVRK